MTFLVLSSDVHQTLTDDALEIQSTPNPNLRYSLRFSQIFFQHVCNVALDTMTCLVLSSDVHQTLTEDA